MAATKKTVLIIGGGAVGAIAAVNLEVGGLAKVTVVLRSNYDIVNEKGYTIESCDHGTLNGWKPSVGRWKSTNDVAKLTLTSSQHYPQSHRGKHTTIRLCRPLHEEHPRCPAYSGRPRCSCFAPE